MFVTFECISFFAVTSTHIYELNYTCIVDLYTCGYKSTSLYTCVLNYTFFPNVCYINLFSFFAVTSTHNYVLQQGVRFHGGHTLF